MTVVTTLITSHYTVLASDSYLTSRQPDGSLKVLEDQMSKLVRIDHWRGAFGYWGLAEWPSVGWSARQFFVDESQHAGRHISAEAHAFDIAQRLTAKFSRFPVTVGLGVHFTCYENVDGYWIPELFSITNWTDPSYTTLKNEGFGVNRETYKTLHNRDATLDEQRQAANRRAVHSALHGGATLLLFNNGDPTLFNPIGNSILATLATLYARRHIRDGTSLRTHQAIARRPVEVVSRLLSDLADKDEILIGGKPHDLAIRPDGGVESSTGDA